MFCLALILVFGAPAQALDRGPAVVVSPGPAPDSRILQWTTRPPCRTPSVGWGRDEVATGVSERHGQYEEARCHNRVTLRSLPPRDLFEYTVHGRIRESGNAELLTHVPPRRGYDFYVGAVGDVGRTPASRRMARAVAEDDALVLFLLLGDLAYSPFAADWDEWAAMMAPVTRTVPTVVVPGNHDLEDGAASFQARFGANQVLAERSGGDARQGWFSFDFGPLHVAVLNSERMDSPEQAAWLARDVAGQGGDWVVVCLHRPPYSSGRPSLLAARDVLAAVEGIDVVLSGHSHGWELARPGGAAYVVSGLGGHAREQGPRAEHPWSEYYRADTAGYARLRFRPQGVTVEFVDTEAQERRSFAVAERPGAQGHYGLLVLALVALACMCRGRRWARGRAGGLF